MISIFEYFFHRLFRKELEDEGNADVEKTIEKQFASWFQIM